MDTGSITENIDVAQIVLYAFWIFFADLIVYLRREDKREGYPLDSSATERSHGQIKAMGFPAMPDPKVFRLRDGTTIERPAPERDDRTLRAEPVDGFPGAPLRPVGDPMHAELGPGAYALRADVPDMTGDGEPCIVPLRAAPAFSIEPNDPDPRGMEVRGADRVVAGTVTDVWVDRKEHVARYLELDIGEGETRRSVMLPINFARVHPARGWRDGHVAVQAILAEQFHGVPALGQPGRITLLEEERVSAYYGAGTLYATSARSEPLL